MISASKEQLQQQLEYTLLKPDCHCWWISKMQSDTLEERYSIKFCLNLKKMPQKRIECFTLLLGNLAWIEHQFLSGIRDSRKAGSLWGMMRGVGGVRKSIDQSWLPKGLGSGVLCWSFKEVQEEIPSEQASTLLIGSVAFPAGKCPSPRLHPRHTLFDHDGYKTARHPPYSSDLAPCDFWLFPCSEVVVMRHLRRWKRLWQRSLTRSHKRTSMGPWRSYWNGTTSALQPEEITSKVSKVSCVYYQ